jgi:2-dehydropantoate 2-reductase
VGSAYAAFLARAGCDVVLIGRGSAHIQAIAARGVTVRPPQGDAWTVEMDTWLHATQVPEQSIDLMLVLTKAFDTTSAVASVAHGLTSDGVVMSPQNGLGCDAALAQAVGSERSLVGVTTVGATLQEPGHISISSATAAGDSLTHVGTTALATGEHRAGQLVALLESASLPAIHSPQVEVPIWEKLALATMSPVCALLQRTVAHIWSTAEGRHLVRALFDEVLAVAASQGVLLDPAATWAYSSSVFEGTGDHFTSLAIDVANGRRTELSTMAGGVHRLGVEAGIPVPAHGALLDLLGVLGVH